jgi:plastocyanin/mono/diheme cytochrome c family protein
MRNSANHVGSWAWVGAAALIALMIAYRVAGGDTKIAVGMSIIAVVTAMLISLAYSRTNAVQRTGLLALAITIVIALMLPIFLVTYAQKNTNSADQQYDQKLHYAAGLFATYCATCHGLLGQGINGPQLNSSLKGHESKALDNFTADDFRRIITGGIPDSTNPLQYLMPQWGQVYGGPLNEDDVQSLINLIMSSDGVNRQKNSAPEATNGFDYVYAALTSPTQTAQYNQQLGALNAPKDAPIDLTAQSSVTVPIVNTPADATAQWNFLYTDPTTSKTSRAIKIKAGTTVTWKNESSVAHSIFPGTPSAQTTDFEADQLIAVSGTYQIKFDKPGTYQYFCSFHPAMQAEVVVVS